jgi:transcriptional regulator with XRE-family HTH domain
MSTPRPELRRIREKVLGVTQRELAERLDVHVNTVQAVEAGSQTPRGERFRRWAEELRITHSKLSEILDGTWVGGDSDENGHTLAVPKKFSLFVALEAQAKTLQVYALQLIDGLLQTERYARTLIENERGMGVGAEQLIALRLNRQKALTRDAESLQYCAILHEAALYVEVGSNQAMREQFEHLEYMAQRPNVEIRVLPFTAGPCHLDNGGFHLLTLPYDDEPSISYEELYDGPSHKESEHHVNTLTRTFNALLSMCLDADQSVVVFDRMKRRYPQ